MRNGGDRLGLAHEALPRHPAGGQLGREYLDGDDAVQRGVEGLQDDAHAAAADFGEYLVRTQPAELIGLVRWAEEAERQVGVDRGFIAGRLGVGLPLQVVHDLLQGGLALRWLAELLDQTGPGFLTGDQTFETVLAGGAALQMAVQLRLLFLR